MRLAAHAHDRCDQGSLFAAHERTRANANFQIEGEIGTENVPAKEAKLARLLDGNIERLHCDRIFCAAVNVTIAGTDCITTNDHAFDHRMRIALQHPAVHERTRVALIRITDHILGAVLDVAGDLPLLGCRETRAAAPAQSGCKYFLDDTFRRHLEQDFAKRLVAIGRQIVFDVVGVDLTAVTQDNADFLGTQRAQLFIHNRLDDFAEALDNASLKEMLFDQIRNIIRGDAHIVDTFRIDHQLGTVGTASDARCLKHLNLVIQALGNKFVLQRVHNLVGTFGKALRVDAYEDMGTIKRHKFSETPRFRHCPGILRPGLRAERSNLTLRYLWEGSVGLLRRADALLAMTENKSYI